MHSCLQLAILGGLCLYYSISACTAKMNVNVARGSKASQSSTFVNSLINMSLSASLAVDGNTDNNVYDGSCMSTAESDTNAWMAIDLGRPTVVRGVQITNMLTACHTNTTYPQEMSGLLYPYGPDYGDFSGPFSDCNNGYTATPLIVTPGFKFINTLHNVIYISSNGLITFGYGNNAYAPYSIPSGFNSIAVFMAKILNNCGKQNKSTGNIYYRVTTDSSLLERASAQVQLNFKATGLYKFEATWLVIVTWNDVTFQNGNSSTAKNTFQAVLVSDGTFSFVILNYGQLTWPSDIASTDDDVIQVTMGVDGGDGVSYYSHPWSMTNSIINLTQSTNCGVNGRFMFRVDSVNVQLPNCPSPQPGLIQTSTLSLMYPYGLSAGDTDGPYYDCNNGYSSKLTILPGFSFYNKMQPWIYIAVNGFLGFNWPNGFFTPDFGLLSSNGLSGVAVFWADVYLCQTGKLFYRVSMGMDPAIMSMARRDVQQGFNYPNMYLYQPTWALIVTWDSVPTYGVLADKTNTFQAVLVTDGLMSFIILNYKQLIWTTGTSCGGNAQGLGGTPAAVGFSAGDSIRSYLHPWSFSGDILKLSQSSNVGVTGRWVYRVDGLTVLQPNYPVPSSAAGSLTNLIAASPSPLMYPFGPAAGDANVTLSTTTNGNCDNGITPVNIQTGFPFLNEIQTLVNINTNGLLMIGSNNVDGCTTAVPSTYARIAVYWSDISSVCVASGNTFYRVTTDVTTLARVSRDVQLVFQSTDMFNPQWVLIVTWKDVLASQNTPPVSNTFQLVLGTDGLKTFVMFNYQQLQWKKSQNCAMDTMVGFDAGDGSTFYQNPVSGQSTILTLATTSNAGLSGRWLYRVDGKSVKTSNTPAITGVVASPTDASNPQLMYPYGSAAGDAIPTTTSCNSGYTSPTSVTPMFPYFNKAYSQIWITADSLLTFNNPVGDSCPSVSDTMPGMSGYTYLSVYMNELILGKCQSGTGNGTIWYRLTTDRATLGQFTYDIQRYFVGEDILYFNPVWAFIVTWDSVSSATNTLSNTNTYQVTLTTDGEITFVIMNYQRLTWSQSSTCAGPALVALNDGVNKNYYAHPWSETNDVLNLANSSNCGLNGRWVYRVDGANVVQPNVLSLTPSLQSIIGRQTPTAFQLMYPYGSDAGDQFGPIKPESTNGCIGPIVAAPGFPYFGIVRYKIYVCVNGQIMLDNWSGLWTPYNLPSSNLVQISAYYVDVYTVNEPWNGYNPVGNLSTRLSTDPAELALAARDVKEYYTYPGLDQFAPTWILVATWENVTYWNPLVADTAKQNTNTFQIVLITDGVLSFVLMNYQKLTWTSSPSSGGNAQGFGGLQALVGFDAGDNWQYYQHPWAITENVINMTQFSNCGHNGRWAYRVDQRGVQLPNQPITVQSTSEKATSADSNNTNDQPEATNSVNTTIPFIVGLTNEDPTIHQPTPHNYVVCNATLGDSISPSQPGLAPDGSVVTLNCPSGLPMYRYVIVQTPTNETLAICEVKVFSDAYAWMQHNNSILSYGVYQSLTVDFRTMCLRICMFDVNCDSVNYLASNHTCQLITQYNDAVVNSTDVVAYDGWEWWCNQYTNWN